MSKELEALECIVVDLTPLAKKHNMEDIKIIETALKRLSELEKAFVSLSKEDEKTKKLLSKEIEKNRALEIIKDKAVNVSLLLTCETKEEYNKTMSIGRILTQEEFDLLKEVLL